MTPELAAITEAEEAIVVADRALSEASDIVDNVKSARGTKGDIAEWR
jgi:hypothetical protein